jgi:predicted metal-dependent peptidase
MPTAHCPLPTAPPDDLAGLDQLNDLAKRLTAEESAATAISAARVKLILGRDARSVFFATLALRLKFRPDWTFPTAATNGREIVYNPGFVCRLTPDQLIGLIAHEVMHCALGHFARRMERDPERWNIATDATINHTLRDAGFYLPPDGVMPGEPGPAEQWPTGLAAEEYYALTEEPKPNPEAESGDEPGDGTGTGGTGWGDVIDAGTPHIAEAQSTAADWQVALAQAQTAAERRGSLPAGLARAIAEQLTPAVDWRDLLREFVTRTARNDYDWSRPNRRHAADGLYLPSLRSDELRPLVIAIDTSGSIDQATLDQFAAELEQIIDLAPIALSILYHDSGIQRVTEWQPTDGPLHLDAIGGGGTDHRPVFDWLAGPDAPPDPAAIICFTDLYTTLPDAAPTVPTLFACTSDERAPFGDTIKITL